MNAGDFTKIVTNRANQRVQVKIKNFTQAIQGAFQSLMQDHYIVEENDGIRGANYKILAKMVKVENLYITDWPKILWKIEEEKVEEELLATMDELQRALLASEPKEGDCKPESK